MYILNKQKNYLLTKKLKIMKKILSLIVILFFSIVTFNSCEEPIPDCERYGYGEVTVKNETGYKIEVDVTWGDMDINSERILLNNGSTTYSRVNAGMIYLWVDTYVDAYGYTPFWTGWEYNTEYLSSCEDLTYRWYTSYGKKSTIPSLTLDVIKDGKIIQTITEFDKKEK